MKTWFNVALGGMFALAFQINAHAAPAQWAAAAYEALQYGSPTAQQWLRQLAVSTGVYINSAQSLSTAVGKLSDSDRAAAIAALQSYTSHAVNPTGNPSAVSTNEQVARDAFFVNGPVKTVGALVPGTATRDAAAGTALKNVPRDPNVVTPQTRPSVVLH